MSRADAVVPKQLKEERDVKKKDEEERKVKVEDTKLAKEKEWQK